MIVLAGGTGLLGTHVVQLLAARGCQVRVLTRDLARARHLDGPCVEVVSGDVRDPGAAARAVAGCRIAISAIHGFSGSGDANPRTVDWHGNRTFIHAARAAGVEHFILVSVHGAAPDHPMDLFRMKSRAEQELTASGLSWTILRPTAYMETWARLIGQPLVTTGQTRIFGRGHNPINFVSAGDVAQFVATAAVDAGMRGERVEIGGPQNLSMRHLAETIVQVTGSSGTVSAVPLPMLRLMAVLMRPINATLARQIRAAVVMDTSDMTFDPAEMQRRYPSFPHTRLVDVVQRDHGTWL